jgi:D-psicose/D-tagatose/L-ribulose 3-epimerase
MKIGMNMLLWTDRPNAREHRALFDQIKGWGFDGVEIPIDPVNNSEARALGQMLDELGLQRTAITALDATVADPSSVDANLRKAAVDTLKRNVEHAREAGAQLLCGPIFQGLGKFTGAAPRADEWKHAVETIREVAEFAKTYQVRLALEAINRFEMYIVNTVSDGAKFVKDVGLPNVGLLVDTHHSNIEENQTAAAWESVAEHIFHVHISENNRGVPGSGHAVSQDVFELLKRMPYEGWVTIEAFGQTVPGLISRLHLWRSYSQHNDDAARLGIEFIRSQLAR